MVFTHFLRIESLIQSGREYLQNPTFANCNFNFGIPPNYRVPDHQSDRTHESLILTCHLVIQLWLLSLAQLDRFTVIERCPIPEIRNTIVMNGRAPVHRCERPAHFFMSSGGALSDLLTNRSTLRIRNARAGSTMRELL